MLSKITFVGGGVMAEAMLQGVLSRKLVSASDITVSEPRKERCQELKAKYGIAVTDQNVDAVTRSRIIVLCIKPQDVASVLNELRSRLEEGQLVISIVAGTRLAP